MKYRIFLVHFCSLGQRQENNADDDDGDDGDDYSQKMMIMV